MKNFKKIFKKVSVFDVSLLALVLILGVTFFIFFSRKSEYVTIRVKVTDQDVLYQQTEPKNWYAYRFQKGDAELDTLGRKITEIVGIEIFNLDSETKAVYLDLKVRAVYDNRTKLYSARGKPLVFGTPMRFNLSTVTFDGFVTEYPNSQFQNELKVGTHKITLLGRSIEPTQAYAMKKGDKIFDSNNTQLAEIVDVTVRPAEKVTQTASGDLLLRYDPIYKDIVIIAMIRTKLINDEAYAFDNMPVKIGETIPLNFPQISLFPQIISIENSSTDQ